MKLGFACKYMHPDRNISVKEIEAIEKSFNTRAVTVKWINSVSKEVAAARCFEIIQHNLNSQIKILNYISTLPEPLHMFRISSDLLPLYTYTDFKWFYTQPEINEYLIKMFSEIGNLARKFNIKVSMHPGQFCVLASVNPNIVEKSLEEFEYHADMIRMMGYGKNFQDFKCNIHISGGLGVEGMKFIYPRLSEVAKNTITIENEEKKYGVNSCIKLSELFPIVLDVHHCWIHEEKYIDIEDKRIQTIIDSWKGIRPTMHYSQSKETLYFNNVSDKLNIKEILLNINKRDLYAHSDKMWNDWSNNYVKEFLEYFDVMFEAKHKNIAVMDFYTRYITPNLN